MGRDDPQIQMDPLEFMLTPYSMTDVEYNSWVSGVPYVGSSLKDWTIRNLTSLTSCLQLLLRYILNLFFFSSFPLPYFL